MRVRAALLAAALTATTPAWADPPVARWTPSLAAAIHTRTRGDTHVGGAFDLHGEVYFGRDPRAVRPGLRVEGRVHTTGELAAAGGASLAVPLGTSDRSPTLVFSAGAAVHGREGLTGAAFARGWFGIRTVRDGSDAYEIALGLWAEARWSPRDGAVDAVFGFSVDPWALVMPVVYLASAFTRR